MEIKIYRNQLKLEIDTETRKAGFFQVNPENQEALNEAQLGSEFSDRAYFERKCQQGIDALLEVLHKFVVACNEENVVTDEADNKLEDTKVWVIELQFDGRRNIIGRSLASMCHKLVAYNMLYSWAVMSYPNLVGEYKEQRAVTLADIQRLVYRKESPTLEMEGDEDAGDGETFADKFNALKAQVEKLTPLELRDKATAGSSFKPALSYTYKGMPAEARIAVDADGICYMCFQTIRPQNVGCAIVYLLYTLTTDGVNVTLLTYSTSYVSFLAPDWVKNAF